MARAEIRDSIQKPSDEPLKFPGTHPTSQPVSQSLREREEQPLEHSPWECA